MKNPPANLLPQMGLAGRTILGIYLLILSALLVYFIVALWPSADPDQSGQVTATLFGQKLTFSIDVQLIVLVVIVAALGGNVHSTMSFIDYAGNRRLYNNWVWWYILRLFIGVSLALIFYFVIRGGFLAGGTTSGDINKFGIAAVAGLVGMFSKQATDKLRELFDTLFKTEKPDERADKLTNPVPVITNIKPDSIAAGATGLSLTIEGENFIQESVVKIGGITQTTNFDNDTQLTASVSDSGLIKRPEIEVTVYNPPPGGGNSNIYKLKVT